MYDGNALLSPSKITYTESYFKFMVKAHVHILWDDQHPLVLHRLYGISQEDETNLD